MGKRHVDHESTLDAPTNKKRKTGSSHHQQQQQYAAAAATNTNTINANTYTNTIEYNLNQSETADANTTAATTAADDVTYSLTTDLVDNVVLTDLCAKKWRCGQPIGKGSFGEIFLASDDISRPVTSDNAKFVVKIEPHKSGPLFVEIHCLIKAGKPTVERPLPLGMPTYMASGGHYFDESRYRFLILPRYDFDLHSIIRNRKVDTKNILIIATQLLDILEHIHDCGYAHSDIKAENIMIGKCSYKKASNGKNVEKLNTANKRGDGGGGRGASATAAAATATVTAADKRKINRRLRMTLVSNESATTTDVHHRPASKRAAKSKSYAESESSFSHKSDDSDFSEDFDKLSDEDDEDEDDDDDDDEIDEEDDSDNEEDENDSDLGSVIGGASDVESDIISSSTSASSDKEFKPFSRRRTAQVEFSGSNPMRSCRKESNASETYDAMVRSHYLRRSTKKVNYCENEDEGDGNVGGGGGRTNEADNDDEWGRKNGYLKRIYSSADKRHSVSAHTKRSTADPHHIHASDDCVWPSAKEEPPTEPMHTEDRIHLIDFGLALKFIDSNGVHRPFVMDQRRAHDGTLEFTSRDAHMGAHSRRSDLECLAYNLIYWKEGYLPWKTEKIMSQPEQVHRMKEYFMTDIKQLYKKFFNVQIPPFIYEFLTHVASLAYHDRPNYKHCKDIFAREFVKLGFKKTEMVLDVAELRAAPMRSLDSDEIDALNGMGQKMADMAKMMKMGMIPPFCETPNTPNQVSPKNLRSKAATQNLKKRRTKFSWTDILSTDPDQIARQRAEKEFDREPDETPVRRYTGRPTYAILQTEMLKSKSHKDHQQQNQDTPDDYIKGYNRAMMDVWRKRQSMLLKELQCSQKSSRTTTTHEQKSSAVAPTTARGRRKHAATTSRKRKSKSKSNNNNYSSTNNHHHQPHNHQTASTTTTTAEHHSAYSKRLNSNSIDDVRIPTTADTMLQNNVSTKAQAAARRRRLKSGLRRIITPTKKIQTYRETTATNNRRRKTSSAAMAAAVAQLSADTAVAAPRSPSPPATATVGSAASSSSESSDASNPGCEISSKIAWWDLNSRGTKNSSSSSSTVESTESLTVGGGGGVAGVGRGKGGRRKYNSSCGMSSPASEEDNSSHDSYIRTRGAHTISKPLMISDESSRDTTDYSPVKNRYKRNRDGKTNRRNKRSNGARAVPGRKVTSELIRTFTRG